MSWRGWLLWLLLICCGQARAAQPVDLAVAPEHVPLYGQLDIMREPGKSLTLQQALANPDWQTATLKRLTAGFSADTYWLQGRLYNSGSQPATRWLSVGSCRLEDIRFYRLGLSAVWPMETLQAGLGMPLALHPVPALLSIFPITLAPGESIRFVLRVRSRSIISISPELWTPTAHRANQDVQLAMEMLLVGSMLTIGLYTLAMGIARRDRISLLLAGMAFSDLVYDLSFQGYHYYYLMQSGGDAALRITGVLPGVTVMLFLALMMNFIEAGGIAFWRWLYRASLLGVAVCTAGMAFADYGLFAYGLTWVLMPCLILIFGSCLHRWRQGSREARLFFLAFCLYSSRGVLKMAVGLGLLSESLVGGAEIVWGNLSIILLLLVVNVRRQRQLRLEKQLAQDALQDARLQEHERLQNAVEERTRELQGALIVADEANRAKSDFLARVSHDLRTPLTSIIGYADLIQAGGHSEAERGGIIRRSATHMLQMINDLIDYAAGGSPNAVRKEPVYIHALLKAIAQENENLTMQSGNCFQLEVSEALPAVLELDGKRLRQLLGNLLDNANKFTQSGLIVLSVDYCLDSNKAGKLSFTVRDSGCGIAAEDQQRIFEPFQRLSQTRSQPGIGLGLSIVKQWVELMDGALSMDSVPGVGTSIHITLFARALPEENMSSYYQPDALGVLPQIDGVGKTIWLAEDTPEIRGLLSDELLGQNFAVEAWGNGLELIGKMQERVPAPDLILTDHMMPGASGLEVLAAARRLLPGVPVVAISALPQAIGPQGFDAGLLKPINLAELRHTLVRLLKLVGQSSVDVPSIPGNAHKPDARQLEEARGLIRLGAMTDLLDWAECIVQGDARYEDFVEQVRQLVRRGELAALHMLCEE
ncbi:ATP-binding protein [Chromobacterium sp. IIBBL 290-4]|uniref:hybrid sensor histidine kinase/response regulator n=1 Tax=Chromobacterium sp. IIBBL 290-4 TaxID=2953890 RepID=UPI0020B889AF|nr:ATP-binding protein [Chromobacterium sp. IIBBL 290-4]UTH75171.1 ATP-binding protein [Chromobacterium sp. IIBBL 290-4]